jgi:hypothetical protein
LCIRWRNGGETPPLNRNCDWAAVTPVRWDSHWLRLGRLDGLRPISQETWVYRQFIFWTSSYESREADYQCLVMTGFSRGEEGVLMMVWYEGEPATAVGPPEFGGGMYRGAGLGYFLMLSSTFFLSFIPPPCKIFRCSLRRDGADRFGVSITYKYYRNSSISHGRRDGTGASGGSAMRETLICIFMQ